MKQKVVFLFFCTVFVAGRIFSQKIDVIPTNLFTQFTQKAVKKSFLTIDNIAAQEPAKQYLPADFYTTQIGFFCKQEIKFEKLTKIPFRFRLGSVEECDRMEGKNKRLF